MNQKRILLIDKDDAFSSRLSDILEGQNYEILTALSGEEGMKLTRRMKPDLILLSVELDDMNGYVVCKKIKEDSNLKSIPLILMSHDADEEDFAKHRKLKIRANDYLIKPFSDEQLLQKINNFLGFHVTEEEFSQMQEQVLLVMQEKVELERKVKEQKEEIENLKELLASSDMKLKRTLDENKKLQKELDKIGEKYNKVKEDIINYLKESD